MNDHVPAEWIGRARLLRNQIAAAFAETEPRMAKLLTPLRPRPGFTASPSDRYFRDLARRWRRLPEAGRLHLSVEVRSGALDIVEFRLVPMRITAADWEDDELALGIGIVAITARRLAPLRESKLVVAAVGLHALARRYERGERNDCLVLADLVALAHEALARGRVDITVAAGDGRWVGRRSADDSLVVRTYLSLDQAAAGLASRRDVRARVAV